MTYIVKVAEIGKPVVEVALNEGATVGEALSAAGVDATQFAPFHQGVQIDTGSRVSDNMVIVMAKQAVSA